jgi:hypothetical protein
MRLGIRGWSNIFVRERKVVKRLFCGYHNRDDPRTEQGCSVD